MAVSPTYPGVYVQELPSMVHTITGVATSVTAFVGAVGRSVTAPEGAGLPDQANHVHSLSEFSRIYGPPTTTSRLSMAVQQFFLNGGSDAWVIRLGAGAAAATANLTSVDGQALFDVKASREGRLSAPITLTVTDEGSGLFGMTVTGKNIRRENYNGLTTDSSLPNYLVNQINTQSQQIQIAKLMHTTLTSKKFSDADLLVPLIKSADRTLRLQIDGEAPTSITLTEQPHAAPSLNAHLPEICQDIQTKVKASHPKFTCTFTDGQIVLSSGTDGATADVKVLAGDANDAAGNLKLTAGPEPLKAGDVALQGGNDGTIDETPAVYLPTASRGGIHALDEVDLFNLLVLPGVQAGGVLQQAAAYCEQRRAILLIDSPELATTPQQAAGKTKGGELTGSKNAAVYYPWLHLPDPNSDAITRHPPSGTVAGMIARTDVTRGVWKAPAGTEASLINVQGLAYLLTDAEHGDLNPLGVNCLRNFQGFGPVAWGARTRRGADDLTDQWKYLPVRRTALYIEESLYRGLKWVVFEPNDEPLWAQIRLNVGAFMHDLFRQGAFQGMTPRDAYLVKCDRETTTQSDIDRGIVNVLVGFAPLKPAEFVILSLQQLAGQLQV